MIEDLKIRELLKLMDYLSKDNNKQIDDGKFWKRGEVYLLQTYNSYFIGSLDAISDKGLILSSAITCKELNYLQNALSTGELDDFETFVGPVFIFIGAIINATVWTHEIPGE